VGLFFFFFLLDAVLHSLAGSSGTELGRWAGRQKGNRRSTRGKNSNQIHLPSSLKRENIDGTFPPNPPSPYLLS